MIFTKEFLLGSLESDDDNVCKEVVGRSRWEVNYRRIFRHDGKFYVTSYRLPATEYQEYDPYGCEGDDIECCEVFPTERTVTVYLTQKEIDNEAAKVAPHR